jgi:membrane protein implicated in regulation of membrane protease activity
MSTSKSSIELLFEKIEEYGKTNYELIKFKLIKTTAIIVPSLISRLIVVLVFFFFMLIFSVGIAFLLSELFDNLYAGFFIVAIFYLIIGILFHFFLYKWIKKPVGDSIVEQMLKQQ